MNFKLKLRSELSLLTVLVFLFNACGDEKNSSLTHQKTQNGDPAISDSKVQNANDAAHDSHSAGNGTSGELNTSHGNGGMILVNSTGWSVLVTSQCGADIPQEKCQFKEGFEIFGNGKYRIGPAKEGQIIEGTLDKSELSALQAFEPIHLLNLLPPISGVNQADAHTASSDELQECLWKDPVSGNLLKFMLKVNGDRQPLCNVAGISPAVQNLIEKVKSTGIKYYPSVFPNPCVDSTQAFQKDFEPLLTCKTDSDCAYLDPDFIPLSQNTSDPTLVLDNCSYFSPIVVANAFEVVVNQKDLLLRRDLVLRVCGDNIQKAGCQSARTLRVSGLPLCKSGKCVINTYQIH